MGAQPVSLHGALPVIAEWLTTVEATHCGSAMVRNRPLAQVRNLMLGVRKLEAPDLARLLRAAPQLRRLTVDICFRIKEASLWLTAGAPITHPAFAGLVHARLRHLVVGCDHARPDGGAADDCAVLLQQHHFPRLRRLTLNEEEYPVSMTE
jgi:hypothetical protein